MVVDEEIPLLNENQVVECLERHCIVPTRQRVQIGQMLLGCNQHLSADQVLDIANNDGVRVSKATVYNTLGLFARKGLLRQVVIDPSRIFYDTNTSPHHHFYNQDTGALSDIQQNMIPIEQLPSVPAGTLLEGVDIIIRVRSRKD